ncbi:MAG: NAD(P)H-dependent oxidoreductase subunit E [Pseudomonadota bacterium]
MRKKFFKFSAERAKRAEKLLSVYPLPRASILPLLWLVQEQEGWMPPEAVDLVADMAGVTPAEVHEVISFYTLFNAKELAMHHIQVCTGLCCRLRNADEIVGHIRSKLGIAAGEATPDGRFYLSTVECLGSCGTAPVMRIGDEYYEDLNKEKVDEILDKLKG